jgi:hypothetical protein
LALVQYHDLVGTFTKTYTDAGEYPVEVIDVLPIIEVVKVADPLQRNEPGGLFTYTYRIYNHSVEPVMLTMVEDDISRRVLYLNGKPAIRKSGSA